MNWLFSLDITDTHDSKVTPVLARLSLLCGQPNDCERDEFYYLIIPANWIMANATADLVARGNLSSSVFFVPDDREAFHSAG
jgi:hypothetical protein